MAQTQDLDFDTTKITENEKKELIISDTISVTSDTTTLRTETLPFTPAKSLHINTQGVAVLRLPLPPRELEITIHNDGGSLAYTSTRTNRNSGNCVLSDANGIQLIDTKYRFGPGKDPVITYLNEKDGGGDSIKTTSKWTSRNHSFQLPKGRVLSWNYRKAKGYGADSAKGTALVMELNGVPIAALIRNQETRSPGSKACSAGNGGKLVLGSAVYEDEDVSEDLVVATCLLMLKKEIDRRRTVQFMMIGAAVSS